ncbi:MAG: hypothetical protein V8R61_01835 [Enterocloster sp.]
MGKRTYELKHGDRISQLVIMPILIAECTLKRGKNEKPEPLVLRSIKKTVRWRMAERSEYIHIRVTPEEVEQIKMRMEQAGINSMTAYLIRMAMHGYVLNLDLPD